MIDNPNLTSNTGTVFIHDDASPKLKGSPEDSLKALQEASKALIGYTQTKIGPIRA